MSTTTLVTEERVCTRCGESKPIDAFRLRNGRWRLRQCKSCDWKRSRRYNPTLRFRLRSNLRGARLRLRRATDPARQAKLRELIAMYEVEIERLEAVVSG